MCSIYFFSSLAAGGGGATLNSSGRFGLVPSPTCSHGESDSKLLGQRQFGARYHVADTDRKAWVSWSGSYTTRLRSSSYRSSV
jgi:hypothetical protein